MNTPEISPHLDSPAIAPLPRQHAPSSVSVVVPCFNEEAVLEHLCLRLTDTLNALAIPYEIILVDDNSRDKTWQGMQVQRERNPRIKTVRLSRNSGQQIALTCGLDQARGEVVIIMDADLQDPPELIDSMIERWRAGYDVVYGQRTNRVGESPFKRFFAFFFYRFFVKFTGFSIPSDTGDFRLMDRRAVDALQSLREKHRFIRGMVSWIGFYQTPIRYSRPKRLAGETKYPFWKSLRLASDAITSFSSEPLRFAMYLGGILLGASLLLVLGDLVYVLLGGTLSTFTLYLTPVLVLGSIQLVALGIIGEYVGRIFEQSQGRPLYLIEDIHGEPLADSQVSSLPERKRSAR